MAKFDSKKYSRNIAKSVKYLSKSLLTDTMPSLDSTIVSAAQVARSIRNNITIGKSNIDRSNKTITQKFFSPVKNIFKNAKSDILSGNIYNTDREDSSYESSLSGMVDDFGDFESSGRSTATLDSEMMISNANRNTEISVTASIDMHNQNVYFSSKNHLEQMAALRNIQALNKTLVSFALGTQSKYITESLAYQKGIYETVAEIKDMIKDSTEIRRGKESPSAKRGFFSDGSFDISKYFDTVRKNVSDSTGLGLDALKMLTSNPIGTVLSLLIPSLVPKNIKSSAKNLDNAINSFIGSSLTKLGNLQYTSNNPFLRYFASLFGIDAKRGAILNLSSYKNQAMDLEMENKKAKALTEVIPTYLSAITSELTGIDKIYDYNTGKFVDRKAARKQSDKSFASYAITGTDETYDKIQKKLYQYSKDKKYSKETIQNVSEDDLNTFMLFLINKGASINVTSSLTYQQCLKAGMQPLIYGEDSFKLIKAAFMSLPQKDKLAFTSGRLRDSSSIQSTMQDFADMLNSSGMSSVYNNFYDDYTVTGKRLSRNKESFKRMTEKLGNIVDYDDIDIDYELKELEKELPKDGFREWIKTKAKKSAKLSKLIDFVEAGFDKFKNLDLINKASSILDTASDTIYRYIYEVPPEYIPKKAYDTISSLMKNPEYRDQFTDSIKKKFTKNKTNETDKTNETNNEENNIPVLKMSDDGNSYIGADEKSKKLLDKIFGEKGANLIRTFGPGIAAGGSSGFALAKLLKINPILGSVVGAGIGILSSSKELRDKLFGPDTPIGKIKDSVVGFARDKIVTPLKIRLENISTKFANWVTKKTGIKFDSNKSVNIVNQALKNVPNKEKPMANVIAAVGERVGDRVEAAIKDTFGQGQDTKGNKKYKRNTYENKIKNDINSQIENALSLPPGTIGGDDSQTGTGPIGGDDSQTGSGQQSSAKTGGNQSTKSGLFSNMFSKRGSYFVNGLISTLLTGNPLLGVIATRIYNRNFWSGRKDKSGSKAGLKGLIDGIFHNSKKDKMKIFTPAILSTLLTGNPLFGVGASFIYNRFKKRKAEKQPKTNDKGQFLLPTPGETTSEEEMAAAMSGEESGKKGNKKGLGKFGTYLASIAASTLLTGNPLLGVLAGGVINRFRFKDEYEKKRQEKEDKAKKKEEKAKKKEEQKEKKKNAPKESFFTKLKNRINKARNAADKGDFNSVDDVENETINNIKDDESLARATQEQSIIEGTKNSASAENAKEEKKKGVLATLFSIIGSILGTGFNAISNLLGGGSIFTRSATAIGAKSIFNTIKSNIGTIGKGVGIASVGIAGSRAISSFSEGDTQSGIDYMQEARRNTIRTASSFIKSASKKAAKKAAEEAVDPKNASKYSSKITKFLKSFGSALMKIPGMSTIAEKISSGAAKIGTKVGKTVVGKAVKNGASKLLKVIPYVNIILYVWDFVSVFFDSSKVRKILRLDSSYKVSIGLKAAAATVNLLDSILFGVLDIFGVKDDVIKFLYGIFGGDVESLEESQSKSEEEYQSFLYKNRLTEEDLSFSKYNNMKNKSWYNVFTGNLYDYELGGIKNNEIQRNREATNIIATSDNSITNNINMGTTSTSVSGSGLGRAIIKSLPRKDVNGILNYASRVLKHGRASTLNNSYYNAVSTNLKNYSKASSGIGKFENEEIIGSIDGKSISGTKTSDGKSSGFFGTIGSVLKSVGSKIVNFFKNLFGGRGDPDYYNQGDPRWSNLSFGKYYGKRDTVGDGGCGPTVAAMALQKITGRRITPDVTAKYALNNGYKIDNDGTMPEFFNSIGNHFGVGFDKAQGISSTTINALRHGIPTVLMGHDRTGTSPYGSGVHYVLGTGMDSNGNVSILDPQNIGNNRLFNIKNLSKNTITSLTPTIREKRVSGRARKSFRLGRSSTSPTYYTQSILDEYKRLKASNPNRFNGLCLGFVNTVYNNLGLANCQAPAANCVCNLNKYSSDIPDGSLVFLTKTYSEKNKNDDGYKYGHVAIKIGNKYYHAYPDIKESDVNSVNNNYGYIRGWLAPRKLLDSYGDKYKNAKATEDCTIIRNSEGNYGGVHEFDGTKMFDATLTSASGSTTSYSSNSSSSSSVNNSTSSTVNTSNTTVSTSNTTGKNKLLVLTNAIKGITSSAFNGLINVFDAISNGNSTSSVTGTVSSQTSTSSTSFANSYNQTINQLKPSSGNSYSSMNNSSIDDLVYKELTGSGRAYEKLPKFMAAGIMGNFKAESGMRSNNLQDSYEKSLGMNDITYTNKVNDGSYKNFVNDGAGYGLPQFTYYALKQGLYDYCNKHGYSIDDLRAQIGYMKSTSEFANFYNAAMNGSNKTKTPEYASDKFLEIFEKPLNPEATREFRRQSAIEYYNKYGGRGMRPNISKRLMRLTPDISNDVLSRINAINRTNISDLGDGGRSALSRSYDGNSKIIELLSLIAETLANISSTNRIIADKDIGSSSSKTNKQVNGNSLISMPMTTIQNTDTSKLTILESIISGT